MEARAAVLVVGAGPVGLFTALLLKRRGLEVTVVEQAEHSEVRSFAVVLHPRTVAMMGNQGLVDALVWQGQSFRRIAVFADGERRALLDAPVDSALTDGGLTLPQNVLRNALERELESTGVTVQYGQQLLTLEQDGKSARSRLRRREPVSSSGRPMPTGNPEERDLVSDFVVGADGVQSSVREALEIAMLQVGKPQTFAFFDVPRPPPAGSTVELAFAEHCSGMYPLHGGMTRYSFEIAAAPKEPLGASELRGLRHLRMPWHSADLETVEWWGTRTFQRAVATQLGRGRVWLAGDACHTANPLGAQSLNVGLREAKDLATGIAECLGGADLTRLSVGYAEQRHLEWRRLLGLGGPPTLGARTPSWAARHFEALVGCLPASGDDLDELLAQLSVTLL